jgi:leucyl/phenylalanyl-tRNA--protein transferase
MGLTLRPAPPAPSPWGDMHVDEGPRDAPVAVGGELSPAWLIGAYRQGAFPWPADDSGTAADLRRRFGPAVASGQIPNLTPDRPATLDLPWWSPDPRGVLRVGTVRVSRSLRSRLRTSGWTTTVNRRFAEVVRRCARPGADAWLTPQIVAAYLGLHDLGWAHSVEVWAGDSLVGGNFGVLVGGVFVGESMFHARADGSKVALVDLAARLAEAGARLIDVQFATAHLRSMGAVEVPRDRFLRHLLEVRDADVRIVLDRLPVDRLVPPSLASRPPRAAAAGNVQPPPPAPRAGE